MGVGCRLGDKPHNWDAIPDFNLCEHFKLPTKHKILKPYTDFIASKIGMKECLRWHHIQNLSKSNREFEVWWFKRNVNKLFRVGMYSRKMKDAVSEVLRGIANKNSKDWMNKNYHNGQ